mmetsp:Transcript_7625/g.16378  ORF Transcript_7625/g.16378 Transcript_7625/m.16378 type:complete len:211 (-) Transcript_7625:32-664(-)
MDKSNGSDEAPPTFDSPVMAAGGDTIVERSDADVTEALLRANELKMEGNSLFAAHQYLDAAAKYSDAIQAGPEGHKEVATFYNNRATCHFKLGNYSAVIADCTSALKIDPDHLKCLVRRAQAYELDKKICEAHDDYQRILKLDATNSIALEASRRLEKPVAEERERLKTEMMGKLKDLGNTVLGKFGLSLDNFKATQDPGTGSYSISFQQ